MFPKLGSISVKTNQLDHSMVDMDIECFKCKGHTTLTITEFQYERFRDNKELMQNIFPEMSPENRELLISRTCPKCWQTLFSSEL